MDRQPLLIEPHRFPRRVYCAGPLFNRAERLEMEHLADVLTGAGFEAFVPHADGMEFARVRPLLAAQGHEPAVVGQIVHSAVFALDVYQVLVGCGALVFNMNGRVPDEGGVAELTMAWMLGKPVVIYKEDERSMIVGRDNPLLVGQADFVTVREMAAVPAALRQRFTALRPDAQFQFTCPPHLEPTVQAGARLWAELAQMGTERPLDTVAELVLELFGPHCTTVED
ncbi:MAG: nucleoside 2-deoxyribosyltransferase [Pirellulales bacterium]|nr:nucleoside 2-deoxyribosyltransferase [Pirellulales bacterium]